MRPVAFVPASDQQDSQQKPKEDSSSSSSTFYSQLVFQDTTTTSELEHKPTTEEGIQCQECNTIVRVDEWQRHLISLTHMTNAQQNLRRLNDTPAIYTLNETNVGYRMLVGAGWNTERGLGVEEQGMRYPIRARQKLDRAGVGVRQRRQQQQPSSLLPVSVEERREKASKRRVEQEKQRRRDREIHAALHFPPQRPNG